MKEEIKFRLGDSVYFTYHGYGTIIGLHNDGREYPIEVRWEASPHGQEVNTFTKDGFLLESIGDCGDNDKLTVVEKVMPTEEEKKDRVSSDVVTKIDTLVKIAEDDAINPSHYQVDGIPEAIEIMEHLMTKEQFEGFLWGNILKYAYRYGRKGDKKETAGKIEWYANHLKDLEEEKRK